MERVSHLADRSYNASSSNHADVHKALSTLRGGCGAILHRDRNRARIRRLTRTRTRSRKDSLGYGDFKVSSGGEQKFRENRYSVQRTNQGTLSYKALHVTNQQKAAHLDTHIARCTLTPPLAGFAGPAEEPEGNPTNTHTNE